VIAAADEGACCGCCSGDITCGKLPRLLALGLEGSGEFFVSADAPADDAAWEDAAASDRGLRGPDRTGSDAAAPSAAAVPSTSRTEPPLWRFRVLRRSEAAGTGRGLQVNGELLSTNQPQKASETQDGRTSSCRW
jgi:hypothetical protein